MTFTLAVVLWVSGTLIVANFAPPAAELKGRRIKPTGDDPRELRRCLGRLARLLDDFERESLTLQGKALKYDMNPVTEWQNWSRRWKMRGRRLEYRCRFRELSGSKNQAVNDMAEIHLALNDLHVTSTSVVSSYMEQYVIRLRTLRKKMTAVRTTIDRQDPKLRRKKTGATR